ncbi:MAG: 4Fe-4S cluster-binding domain-containing protein [bacterium]|nr:4Fe-4S cluster-binding domain-containing protein [bacterium]
MIMEKRRYIDLHKSGELKKRIKKSLEMLESCELCPRKCKVNRLNDERGFCGAGRFALLASYGPHMGEEIPLVGKNGSGTIFVGGCNLKCIFCQNYEISHVMYGEEVEATQLAQIMLKLQNIKCHNINIVTPTHIVPQILEALPFAIEQGLNLPLIYNSSAYDNKEVLELLDGVVDIYMPDFKFWDSTMATQFAGTENYPLIAQNSIKEMHRQVGDLVLDENGLAERGLIARHLLLPDDMENTKEIVNFFSSISTDTYVNIMDQYRPYGNIEGFPSLAKKITSSEFNSVLEFAKGKGLYRFL